MKVALFDFCDTIVSFQTADAYTDYVVDHITDRSVKCREKIYCCLKCLKCLSDFLSRHGAINKRLKLWRLKGLSKSLLEDVGKEFYDESIRPCLHAPIISLLRQYQKDGYKVYIVSGGYDIYLQFFMEEYELDGMISTKLCFKKNDMFSGHIDKKDCMHEEKVEKLNQFFKGKKIDYSISYSDSITDLPMLKWTDVGVAVSKYQHRKWPDTYHLKQIVIKDMEC